MRSPTTLPPWCTSSSSYQSPSINLKRDLSNDNIFNSDKCQTCNGVVEDFLTTVSILALRPL